MAPRPIPAKITPPRAGEACERSRLWARLDADPAPAAVWLQAPAGYGKTMGVAGWLRARGRLPLWYRMDEGDADPATFFDYLRLSLPPASASALPAFTADYRLALPTFARRWFEQWWALQGEARGGAPICVFDDEQDAGADGLHHDVMRQAVEQAPDGALVLVLSRREPPPYWARLESAGQLRVLQTADILFEPEEALNLARLHRPDSAPEALQGLVQASQGRAAGLVLLLQRASPNEAGRQMADRIDQGAASLDAPARQRVFDYFAHEVVRHLPADTVEVLRVAAWSPVADAELIAHASGLNQAGQVLEDLSRRGLFTTPVGHDEEGRAEFQFHPLFRAYLRSAVVQGADAQAIRRRQHAVAQALAAHGQAEPAVALFVMAGDPTQALSLVRGLHQPWIQQGRHQRLLQLMTAVPSQALEQDPWALLARGQARALLSSPQAEPDLRQALTLFEASHDHDGITAVISVVLMTLTGHPAANPGDMRPYFERLAAVESEWRGSPVWRHTLLRTLLGARWFSDPSDPRIDRWLLELRQMAEALATPAALASWLHPELMHSVVRGDYNRVRAALRMLDDIEPGLKVADLQALFRFLRVYALNRLGEHARAVQAFESAVASAQAEGALLWAYQISMHGVEALMGAGQWQRAQQLLDELRLQLPVEQGFAAIFHSLLQGGLCVARGQLDDALLQVQTMRERLATADVALFHVLVPLTLGWVQVARHEAESSHAAFGQALQKAQALLGSHLLQFDAMLGLSEACWQAGQAAQSLDWLGQALALGRGPRYALVYYIQPADLSALLDRALQAGIERDYVLHIVRLRQLPPPPSRSADWVWPVRVRCLGGLEIEREVEGVRDPIRFAAKTPKKLLQLLKALVALGGDQVPEARLVDAVWPELEADQAAAALKVALVRLNALFGEPGGWVWQRAGAVSLDTQRIWLDTDCLDRLLDGLLGATDPGRVLEPVATAIASPDAVSISRVEALLRLYRGPFLPADADEPWARPLRERLRQRVVQALLMLVQSHLQHGDAEAALAICLRGFERDTLSEPLVVQAMELQRDLGRRLEALALYERLREALGRELGLRPSTRAAALQRELIGA